MAPRMPRPPSTGKTAPVMNDASSEARYSAAEATSAGDASRPNGIVETNAARPSSGSLLPMNVRSIGVSAATGQMATARMR